MRLDRLCNKGWSELKGFLRRIVPVRAHWSVYAAALLVPAGLAMASVALPAAAGTLYNASKAITGWKSVVDAFLFILLFVALGEEPAWRG